MKALKGLLLSSLLLIFGISSVSAQIAAAEIHLISNDGSVEFTKGVSTTETNLIGLNPYFEIRNASGETMDEFQISGGEVFAFNGDLKEKIGAVNTLGEFDAASKLYIETAKNIRIDVALAVKSSESELPMTMNYFFYVNLGIPSLFLGETSNGSEPDLEEIMGVDKIELLNHEAPKILNYKILSGSVTAEGITQKGKILENGILNENAKSIIKKATGKQVTFLVIYLDTVSGKKMRTALVFTVNS